MSLPQKDAYVCANCKKVVGVSCKRKRRVSKGYCTEFVSVGVIK
jgi:hypothetical protein